MTLRLVANVAALGFIGLSSLYLGKIWYSYRFFKTRNIKTPPYSFFFGNYKEIKKQTYSKALQKWTQEYGKTYGIYEGHNPFLITSDLDIIQEVFIKQYSNFAARRKNTVFIRNDDDPNVELIMATKSRWKRMRVIMNPTFSASKLRELCPLITMCTDRFINVLQSKVGNIKINEFTMDTIWACAFGIDIDMQHNTDNPYYLKSEQLFKGSGSILLDLQAELAIYFYEFKPAFFNLTCLLTMLMATILRSNDKYLHPYIWIRNKISEVVEERKRQKIKRKDYVQILLDAQSNTNEIIENSSTNLTGIHLEKKLTQNEVTMNLVLFMLAGYETSSNTLSNCAFILAKHPDEQRKLYDEITSNFASDEEPNSDNVNKLEYMDMFIKEVLRLFPIGNTFISRRCTNPTNIKGIDIPLDMNIAVDVLSIHMDPELWGPIDPNLFYPKRFSHEIKRNPLAFLSFGIGPRNCIGMKFALVEMKINLAKLLLNFEVLPGDNMPEFLEYIEPHVHLRKSRDPVEVKLNKRISASF